MCPACYINGLLFLIFGASGVAVASNPWIISLSILVSVAGISWMYLAYSKNQGQGGLKTNLKNTVIYISLFLAGFITATYITHDYFEKYSQQQEGEK